MDITHKELASGFGISIEIVPRHLGAFTTPLPSHLKMDILAIFDIYLPCNRESCERYDLNLILKMSDAEFKRTNFYLQAVAIMMVNAVSQVLVHYRGLLNAFSVTIDKVLDDSEYFVAEFEVVKT